MNADKNFKFKTIRWPPTCYYNSLIKHENVLDISSDYFKYLFIALIQNITRVINGFPILMIYLNVK